MSQSKNFKVGRLPFFEEEGLYAIWNKEDGNWVTDSATQDLKQAKEWERMLNSIPYGHLSEDDIIDILSISLDDTEALFSTTVEKVVMYRTKDGRLFETEREALIHLDAPLKERFYQSKLVALDEDNRFYAVSWDDFIVWLRENANLVRTLLDR